jgi:hypothetical protein
LASVVCKNERYFFEYVLGADLGLTFNDFSASLLYIDAIFLTLGKGEVSVDVQINKMI